MRVTLLLLALLLGLGAPASAQKRIALSFDDVPRQAGAFFTPDERTKRLIAALKRGRVRQAAFFVTTGNLDKPDGVGGEARIAAYAAAGHVIANHSHGHRRLSRMTAEDYLADVDRAETWLAGRTGHRPWFRFPFLDESGRDVARRDSVRAGLAARGLANAYVTIDSYDWHLDSLASKAKREGKRIDMAKLRDLYVETLVDTANFYDRIAVRTLGRSPAHMLLLHETDLAAMFVDDLAAALRADGWTIVTADDAYRDPIAAREPDSPFLGSGRIAALAQETGMAPADLVHPRTDEKELDRLFAAQVLGEAEAEDAEESGAFIAKGPARICIRDTSIDLEPGESAFSDYLGIHWATVRVTGPLGTFLVSDHENLLRPRRRVLWSEDERGRTIARRYSDGELTYLILAGRAGSDRPRVRITGDALGRSTASDEAILERVGTGGEPAGCARRLDYGLIAGAGEG